MALDSTIHAELEVKLDAKPDFALPALTGIGDVIAVVDGGTHELSAFYLDTPDLRLARHGTTLRRRNGGADAGWHLKLPAGKEGRTEIQEPLGESIRDVPQHLLDLARVQLQGADVAPVARIETVRTIYRLMGEGDQLLAEVADDQVTAQLLGSSVSSQSWREIEVESATGVWDLPRAVSGVLVRAGARPASAGSKLGRTLSARLTEIPGSKAHFSEKRSGSAGAVATGYLYEQVQALIAEDPHVQLDIRDGVHQMRVATRRLRTALATFRPVFVIGSEAFLRDELKWLAGVLGAARDAEVMREHLQAQVAALPPELVLGPVAARITLELNAAHRQAHDVVLETLRGERYLVLVQALEAFVAAPPLSKRAKAPAADVLQQRMRSAGRRVTGAVAAADAAQSPRERDELLHEVRKTAKRARYAAEAAKNVVGKKAKRVQQVMTAIQENLGDHQDAVVERVWLRDLGARAFLNGENGFTFGLLHGLTALRAEHDEQEFTRLWAQAQATLSTWPA